MEEIVLVFHPPPAEQRELLFFKHYTQGKPLFLVSITEKLIFYGDLSKPDVTVLE